MLKASRARCVHVGLLWLLLCICHIDGLIEIVEEQKCYDTEFRLTCRELNSHIAVLEAWYTSAEDYQNITVLETPRLKTENDSELNKVYTYSSPKHNGIYQLTNYTYSINETYEDFNETWGYWNDTVDIGGVNVSEDCGVPEFLRSYGSWREGDKRRPRVARDSSVNLRAPVSYRCAGINHCNFLLPDDYPLSKSWSTGAVYIKYACFDDTPSIHYCNREVWVAEQGADSEGYIRTPGYPDFYVGDECRWRLRSHPQQKIRVTLLDVSLRTIGPFENNCTDYVSVQDLNGESLLSSCEQVDLPLRLTSITNTLDVILDVRSQGAYPKRGVLWHYKSIGCVTLPPPSSGYLVYRKEDVAHYMCDVNYVFVDTRQRARLLWCYDDNRWNDTVPLCVEEAASKAVGNDSVQSSSGKETKIPPHDEPNMLVETDISSFPLQHLDIVIPSLLIAALFIGNAFIVLIIYKYRKRKTEDIDDEFNTIPLSVNGNVLSAGNAV